MKIYAHQCIVSDGEKYKILICKEKKTRGENEYHCCLKINNEKVPFVCNNPGDIKRYGKALCQNYFRGKKLTYTNGHPFNWDW
ncbi:MAG TPA: hypothetical protein ENN38_01920 [Actinobacteria bacterium]|nr:hypothetical protein [Actinomycetota bacterium]